MSILTDIVAAGQKRLAAQMRDVPMEEMQRRAAGTQRGFVFEKALAQPGMQFICEVKKASPSKGVIAAQFPYLAIAREYEAAGAAAISVLTEPEYFLGSTTIFSEIRATVATPLLRKDFLTHPYQIYESAALGADAVLLICAVLREEELRQCIRIAHGFGISCLVEAHTEAELRTALAAGARVVGVNNRNLHDFSVDLENSLRLREHAGPGTLFVAESGVHTAADVAKLYAGGIRAVLVGEALMRSEDKAAALATLRGGEKAP